MAVYVIASLTIKDTVRFEDYRRMLLPTTASMARDWLRAAAPSFSRETKVWLLVGIPVIASFDRIGIWKLIPARSQLVGTGAITA
jgi:hypothetical protein